MSARMDCAVCPTTFVVLVCCALSPHCPQFWAPAGRLASSRPAIVLHTYCLARNENIIVCPPSQVFLGKAERRRAERTAGHLEGGSVESKTNDSFGEELAR